MALARPKGFIGTPRAHLLRLLSPAVRQIPVQITAGRSLLSLRRCECPKAEGAAAAVAADAPALITFTTGSTGRPKAAARSHGFLWAQHTVLAEHLGLTEADVDMPTLPVFVLNNLALGVTSVLPAPASGYPDPRHPAAVDPALIFRQIDAEGVTTSSGSPAFYERLAHWCAAQDTKLPLRALFTGGAPVLPPLARLLAETAAGAVHVVYGSTEAEPIASIEAREMLAAMTARGGEPMPEGVCVGRPVPQVELRLLRPSDEPIMLGEEGWAPWEAAEREVGEVAVTGAHVLAGYLNNPEADRENKIREGGRVWHRTGDAARLDREGRLWLMGRVSVRVRRQGAVWWPMPAEVRALAAAGVTHAAYLGISDAKLGQRALLCVETPAGRLAAAERERLLAALAPIPVDDLRAFARIPRDPRHASKTDTEALRRRF